MIAVKIKEKENLLVSCVRDLELEKTDAFSLYCIALNFANPKTSDGNKFSEVNLPSLKKCHQELFLNLLLI